MKNTDWLPSRRSDLLTMCRTWISVFTEDTADSSGQTVKKRVAWGIPDVNFNDLDARFTAAQTALTKAQEAETRTHVTTAACKTAFDALVGGMRNVKKRWLHVGPLTPADLKSLGLEEHDTTPTRSGVPTAQVTIETFLVGRHQLGLRFIYVSGDSEDPANKGFRFYYRVMAQGETPPATPEELYKSDYTKRKKDVKDFDFGDSGKVVWFAVQIENEGKKGPWGPLTSALIP